MKNLLRLIIIILAIIAIVLFGYNNYQKKLEVNNNPIENVNDEEKELKAIELDIEYGENEVEFDYELIGMVEKSSYKNEFTNEVSDEGNESIINSLKEIDYTAPESQVVDQVLKAFDLKGDFTKFDLEIRYNNNTKIEIEIKDN